MVAAGPSGKAVNYLPSDFTRPVEGVGGILLPAAEALLKVTADVGVCNQSYRD